MNIQGLHNYGLQTNYLNNKKYTQKQEGTSSTINTQNNISFQGSKESKFGKWLGKFFGKHYAKPMADKEWLQNASEKMTNFPGQMTEHMATLGSILTSSVYMYKTVKNKDLDDDKRKTLAINQGLCCLIPTIGAYTVSSKLSKFKKNVEYRYCGLKEQQVALGQISKEEAKILKESLGNKLKGLNALTGLITFTLIYRYVTPVIVTPVANWIGNKLNAKSTKAKQPVAKEIVMTTSDDNKKINTAA